MRCRPLWSFYINMITLVTITIINVFTSTLAEKQLRLIPLQNPFLDHQIQPGANVHLRFIIETYNDTSVECSKVIDGSDFVGKNKSSTTTKIKHLIAHYFLQVPAPTRLNRMLLLPNVTKQDAGRYECIARVLETNESSATNWLLYMNSVRRCPINFYCQPSLELKCPVCRCGNNQLYYSKHRVYSCRTKTAPLRVTFHNAHNKWITVNRFEPIVINFTVDTFADVDIQWTLRTRTNQIINKITELLLIPRNTLQANLNAATHIPYNPPNDDIQKIEAIFHIGDTIFRVEESIFLDLNNAQPGHTCLGNDCRPINAQCNQQENICECKSGFQLDKSKTICEMQCKTTADCSAIAGTACEIDDVGICSCTVIKHVVRNAECVKVECTYDEQCTAMLADTRCVLNHCVCRINYMRVGSTCQRQKCMTFEHCSSLWKDSVCVAGECYCAQEYNTETLHRCEKTAVANCTDNFKCPTNSVCDTTTNTCNCSTGYRAVKAAANDLKCIRVLCKDDTECPGTSDCVGNSCQCHGHTLNTDTCDQDRVSLLMNKGVYNIRYATYMALIGFVLFISCTLAITLMKIIDKKKKENLRLMEEHCEERDYGSQEDIRRLDRKEEGWFRTWCRKIAPKFSNKLFGYKDQESFIEFGNTNTAGSTTVSTEI